ncbi:hypothetical protein PIB30_013056 [Stylosanthes scabra]|uniref:DUF7963 domain-containing protein n=1 Tax=Stylosanthes scabra TaxID=79078 RepID=A0ABU6T764_9FABA|nr:hypothetical protein [Stylosanthes scabra]
MASTNSTSTEPDPLTPTATATATDDGGFTRAANKRYQSLITVRTRAIKGKGAWYWAHLEPLLVRTGSGGCPAVKLRCSLCDAVFSASNPSRTASEHLKRGTCPNFNHINSSLPSPSPASSVSPAIVSNSNLNNNGNHCNRGRERTSPNRSQLISHQNHNLAMVELGYSHLVNNNHHNYNQNQNQNQNLVLSGGKDDLCALAVFEESVKKLKSPKINAVSSSPSSGGVVALSKEQVDSAVELLADWFYESCGSMSLSMLEHPKFQAFLARVGFPAAAATTLSRGISGPRLEERFSVARAESEARIRDAMFFQLCSDGWKNKDWCGFCYGGGDRGGGDSLVKFTVNLPNGTSVFHKAVFTGAVGGVSSEYAEEVFWESVKGVSGCNVQRCVGIVSDKFKGEALRNLEVQNSWMVNISCQLQGFISLIKDFSKELPIFRVVTENCLKVANFFNGESQVRSSFLRYRAQELDHTGLIRLPSPKCDPLKNFAYVFPMLEDILSSARVIQMVMLEETFKILCTEDPLAREIARIIQNEVFWNELETVYSLGKLIRGVVQDIEAERPLIGKCLPLWEDLRSKVKEWCAKYNVAEELAEEIIEKRFRKNYHPAWSAAFILDPLYLIKDTSGKYLPPFKYLTREQEKDVDRLLTRLASSEEAHVVLMELMKWRTEGLDPLYAQAVQMKQHDPATGKMKLANPLSRRLVWETCLSELRSLGKIAVRLIFLHATSCGFKTNCSLVRKISAHKRSRISSERAQKMLYIAAHAKLDRRDFSDEEEKEAELLAMTGSDDSMLAEVFSDAPSM